MFPDSICEPAGAAQHLSCPSCLDIQKCRPTHDFPTTYAALVDMFSNECTMMDGTSKTLRRENSTSSKRSVHSMKSLLPLKLLSSSQPQSDLWPSTSQDPRSTFGAVSTQENSKIKSKTNNPLGLRLSLGSPRKPQRDTPIYNEPGSPLPGRAYYTSDGLCFNCSPPGSSCDEGCVFQYYSGANIPKDGNELNDEVANQPDSIESVNLLQTSASPRSSGLSFQCSGEKLFPSEAAWLSSSLPNSPNSQLLRRRSTLRLPLERNVESWLSDTASQMGEDVLARATIISPKRAHMVDVNTNRLSDESIPPRVSSLNTPSSATLPVGGRYSWSSSDDSTLDTPTRECEFDGHGSPCRESQWIFPNRRFDLAMNSPPVSPKIFPDPPAVSRFSYSVMSAGIETEEDDESPNMASRWSFDSTGPEQKLNVDIITDLEDIVLGFPSSILLPDTPCISEIRSSLSSSTPNASHNTSYFSHGSRTGFNRHRKSVANFSRPRVTNYLSSSRSTPMINNTAWRSSYISSSSTIQPQFSLPPPDLGPLSRIFPNSSEFTRLALYANIIAYIFVTSIPTESLPVETSARRRRDTPYWTTPPLPSQTVASLSQSGTSNSLGGESGLQTRIMNLKSSLRKCIFRLMKNMDSSICQPNNGDLGSAREELMLRAVEETVRGSEKLSTVAF